MAAKQKLVFGTAMGVAALGLAILAARLLKIGPLPNPLAPVTLMGAVLRQDDDPRNQTPLSNVEITAVDGSLTVRGKSDSSGFFELKIRQSVPTGRRITLKLEYAGYKRVELTVPRSADRLYIVRMQPLGQNTKGKTSSERAIEKITRIKDVRIRYLSKDQSTVSAGSLAKQVEIPNIGNIPCDKRQPCSPDGKWKAAANLISLDAPRGNEFQNVSVSCVAGPCPFTKVESDHLSPRSSQIRINVLNWSDTTDFLVEADVSRNVLTDKVHHSYPFIVGQTMNFALPQGSEGLSIEANLNGQEIVFPIGPDLILTWATCGVETPAAGNRLYRCQLKPGYVFAP
jgi:hypothetical protein